MILTFQVFWFVFFLLKSKLDAIPLVCVSQFQKLRILGRYLRNSFPIFRLPPCSFSENVIQEKLLSFQQRTFNFDGDFTQFSKRSTSILLGRNENDYSKLKALVQNLDIVNKLPWAKLKCLHGSDNLNVGCDVATLIKCYGLIWFLNPCRVIENNEEIINQSKYYSIAYQTLEGHLIAGIERFIVTHDIEKENVYLTAESYSKGSCILIRLFWWLITPLQDYFFRDIANNAKKMMNSR